MPLLNYEVSIALLICYTLVRLNGLNSIPHMFLNGLKLYLPPSDEDIARIQIPKHKRSKEPTKKKSVQERVDTLNIQPFSIPQNFLRKQSFYMVYEILVILFMSTLLTFLWSSAYQFFILESKSRPSEWCTFLLVVLLVFSIFCNLSVIHSTGYKTTEGWYGTVLGVAGFVLALIFLYSPVHNMLMRDNFNATLGDVHARLQSFLKWIFTKPIFIYQQVFVFLIKLNLALLAGGISAGLAIPSIRFSRCFVDRMVETKNYGSKALLYLGLVLPALVVALFSPTVSMEASVSSFHEQIFRCFRLGVLFITVCIHLGMTRSQLQTFLQSGKRDILPDLEPEQVDGDSIKLKIRAPSHYLVIAACQYLSPVFVLCALFMLLLRKNELNGPIGFGFLNSSLFSLGLPVYDETQTVVWEEIRPNETSPLLDLFNIAELSGGMASVAKTSSLLINISQRIHNFVILTDDFYKGAARFLCFWTCIWYFFLYGTGIAFWKLFWKETAHSKQSTQTKATKQH